MRFDAGRWSWWVAVRQILEVPEHEKNQAKIATSEQSCVGGNCHVSPHPKAAANPESAHAS